MAGAGDGRKRWGRRLAIAVGGMAAVAVGLGGLLWTEPVVVDDPSADAPLAKPDCALGKSRISRCLPDPALAALVAQGLGKSSASVLTAADVAAVDRIEADPDPMGVRSLAGMEVLTALESLRLPGQRIDSLEGLSGLAALRDLDLSGNRIANVDTGVLATLTALAPGADLTGQVVDVSDSVDEDAHHRFWLPVPTVGGVPVALDPDADGQIVPQAENFAMGDGHASFTRTRDTDTWRLRMTQAIDVATGGSPIPFSATVQATLPEEADPTTLPPAGSAGRDSEATVEEADERIERGEHAPGPQLEAALGLLHKAVEDPSTECSIILLGSSTAAGGRVAHPEQGWSYRLGYRLGGAVERLDDTTRYSGGTRWYHGPQGGATSATYVPEHRLAQIRAIRPDYVVHMIGSNDWATNVDPEVYRANLERTAAEIEAASPDVVQVFIHQQPRSDSAVEQARYTWAGYGKQMAGVAAERPGHRFFIDLNPALLGYDKTSGTNAWGLVAPDHIHLMSTGNRIMADLVGTYLGIPSETGAAPVRETLSLGVDGGGAGAADAAVTVPAAPYPRMVRVEEASDPTQRSWHYVAPGTTWTVGVSDGGSVTGAVEVDTVLV